MMIVGGDTKNKSLKKLPLRRQIYTFTNMNYMILLLRYIETNNECIEKIARKRNLF